MRSTTYRATGWALAGGLRAVLLAVRRYKRVWGTTPTEAAAPLPGDEILGRTDPVATRAVNIQAPPEDVWP